MTDEEREAIAVSVLEIFKAEGRHTWCPRLMKTLAGPRVTIGTATASYAWVRRDGRVMLSSRVPGVWREQLRSILKSHGLFAHSNMTEHFSRQRLAMARRRISEIGGHDDA